MSVLYPRLLPGAASRLLDDLKSGSLRIPGDQPDLRWCVYAATGGRRATPDDLRLLRTEVLQIAESLGFPGDGTPGWKEAFDVTTARLLHSTCDMTPAEASQRSVWSYLGLVLLPDVCGWRYPADAIRGFNVERFHGSDLTRHTLAKLWTRAHLLHDADAADPYYLLPALGENDMDQILTRRRDIASTPALVRTLVRVHVQDAGRTAGAPADGRAQFGRLLFRDSLKRLMRLAAFVDLDSRTQAELETLVRSCRRSSWEALTKQLESAASVQ